MAVANGFGKVVTSGSVFMYDTGDTINSYIGEPTTNTVGNLNSYNPLDLYTWASTGNTSTWSRDTSAPPSPVKGIPLKEVSSGTDSYSDTYNTSQDNISAASSGQTWTVSVYALANAGTNLQIWIFGANSSGNYVELALNGYGVTATGQWQRISVTMTFSNGSTAYVQSRVATSTNGGVVWWDGLQVEQKPNPTQFTTGTRSATQGLLPLVGNSTIDLSNVSFDSNAQIVFDGTDDFINLSTDPWTANDFADDSISIWFKFSSAGVILGQNMNAPFGSNGWVPAIYIDTSYQLRTSVFWGGSTGNQTVSPSALLTNTWYNVTVTNEGGTQRTYLNGELIGTLSKTQTSYAGVYYYTLGAARWNGWGGTSGDIGYISGQIANLYYYNKTLSASEVQQNYNKYKTRFNLP